MMNMVKYMVRVMALLLPLLLIATGSVFAVAVPGQSTAPVQSLPYNLDLSTNIIEPDTVVIAVADPSDYSVLALADVVANHIKAPVLITQPSKLDPAVVEAITQMLSYGNLEKAVVIGTSGSTTTVAGLVADIENPITGKNIQVVNIIYADTPQNLSIKTSTYMWSYAPAVIVTDGYVQSDVGKAVLMSAIDGIPVIYEQAGVTTVTAVANMLGAKTIYVTPAVDPDTISSLQSAGFTVNSSWHNISSISATLEQFILDAQQYKNASFIVVKERDLTPYDAFIVAMSIYSLSNSTVVIANSSVDLGTAQTSFLTSESPAMIVLVGDLSVASETLSNTIAATTGKVPWRIVYDSPVEMFIELALAGSNYYYPVVVSYYTQTNNTFTYYFKNIGFSDVVKFDKYSLRTTFTKQSGSFISSTEAPVAQNETLVVFDFDSPIYPHDQLVLTFTVAEGTKFSLVPKLEYYSYTLAGTVKPLQGFFDYIVSYFSAAKSWIANMFNTLVGVLSVYIPLPSYAITAIAAFITFLILWSVVGLIVYLISLAAGRKVERYGWYGLIVWLIKGVRRK